MQFGDHIGLETLDKEFKEFGLHKTGIPFSLSEAEHLCQTNQFVLDALVKETIPKYISYVPKYVCGFWNSGINGDMYIGVDDYGIVRGIPVKKGDPLSLPWIETLVRDEISKKVKSLDGAFSIPITVELLSVEVEKETKGIHPTYERYLKKKKQYEEDYASYVEAHKKWNNEFQLVNMKLVDIVNHPLHRLTLISYMEQSPYRNKVALQTIYHPSYQLPSLSGEGLVRELKHDPETVFYWVTNFKDELSVRYKKYKPTFHKSFKQRYVPYNLLISMSDMIPYWYDQVDVYVIRISFGTQPTSRFQYDNGTEWISCCRIMDHDQPVCMPQ